MQHLQCLLNFVSLAIPGLSISHASVVFNRFLEQGAITVYDRITQGVKRQNRYKNEMGRNYYVNNVTKIIRIVTGKLKMFRTIHVMAKTTFFLLSNHFVHGTLYNKGSRFRFIFVHGVIFEVQPAVPFRLFDTKQNVFPCEI